MNAYKTLVLIGVFVFMASAPSMAMDMDHGQGSDAIHTSTVDGATLTYKLIDMRENMKAMGHDMANMDMATHHLMVYAKDAKGAVKGKAGFVITGPDGNTEKVMCMAMGDGFGADIKMKTPGNYTIKTKVSGNGKDLKDEFTYNLMH